MQHKRIIANFPPDFPTFAVRAGIADITKALFKFDSTRGLWCSMRVREQKLYHLIAESQLKDEEAHWNAGPRLPGLSKHHLHIIKFG